MAEPPADILRRAAAVVRERAELGADVVPRERKFLAALAESWDCIAEDMVGSEAFECRPLGVVSSVDDGYRADWTATLKAARAYVGDETPT